MPTIRASSNYHACGTFERAFQAFADELKQFARAIMSPNKIIAEVEQMHALQLEAARVEATDPEQASALRQQAARVGLR
jgi:cell fate (sporulation/competence/biofilm development) regulator YmcA (YheA/YmcA/DUF963 family)